MLEDIWKVLTNDVISRDQGELETIGDACIVTAGGIRVQRRKARVKPSRIERGSSSSAVISGTAGRASTTAWIAPKSPTTAPEIMYDGIIPSIGAVTRHFMSTRGVG